MRKLNFTTLYPFTTNHNLTKDVGLIPYFIGKTEKFESTLVSYKCDKELFIKLNLHEFLNTIDRSFPSMSLSGELDHINLIEIPYKSFFNSFQFSLIFYILKNARKIDVLNLFHLSDSTYLLGLLYKIINPHGFLYVKADLNPNISTLNLLKSRRFIFRYNISKFFFRKVSLITAESNRGILLLKQSGLIPNCKIMLFPNGVNDLYIDKNVKPLSFDEKENIILIVSRFGSPDKNIELVLRYIEEYSVPDDWKFVFAGPIDDIFQEKLSLMYRNSPFLSNKLLIKGNITNRLELYNLYNSSKIYCMPSRKEGFPISIAEALYFGNYCILSNGIATANDIVIDNTIGVIFESDNLKDFSDTISSVISDSGFLNESYPSRISHGRTRYRYSTLIKELEKKIVC